MSGEISSASASILIHTEPFSVKTCTKRPVLKYFCRACFKKVTVKSIEETSSSCANTALAELFSVHARNCKYRWPTVLQFEKEVLAKGNGLVRSKIKSCGSLQVAQLYSCIHQQARISDALRLFLHGKTYLDHRWNVSTGSSTRLMYNVLPFFQTWFALLSQDPFRSF